MLTLEKYHGSGSRHTCPACGKAKKFTRYIDSETGRYLAEQVGRCDRESSCGYHLKPKEYFADNPHLKGDGDLITKNLKKPKIHGKQILGSKQGNGVERNFEGRFSTRKPDFLEPAALTQTLANYDRNSFVQFLLELFPFDPEDVWKAVKEYLIGSHETGRTIFWQIDQTRRIRTGKAFAYDRATGKRDRQKNPFFLHPKTGFELQQCFFGEHLLRSNPGLPIAITEGEKSAVIGSICKGVFPEMVWLSCGGKSNLKAEQIARLGHGRTTVLYPDSDGFEKWQAIASDARKLGLTVNVSDLIERRAPEVEKAVGVDLADYLIRLQTQRNDPANREAFRDRIEERLAIMTIDGGLTLEQAESEIIASGFYSNAIRDVLVV